MRSGSRKGFTLVELLVVMAVIALLVSLAAPRYFTSIDKAKESALRESLMQLRQAVDRHFADVGRYPGSLDELVARKYLRGVPVDPFTERKDTWIVVPPEDKSLGAVFEVRSGARGQARDGTSYDTW
jgi:general secretion pathway protein G